MQVILFVDDDENILSALVRQLRRRYHIHVANCAEEALERFDSTGPYAVVVSDLRMPGMDGIEFLSEVRKRSPETVRIMLTGYADLEVSMAAVNNGHVFRFLTKPVAPDQLIKALDAALAQHRLITTKNTFMEETLGACLKLLSDVLALVSPVAFSNTARVKRYVRHMAAALGLPKAWRYILAADLSQIGCISVPPAVLEKRARGEALSPDEEALLAPHPQVAAKLIAEIPRLEVIAEMVARQREPFADLGDTAEPRERDPVALGAQLLHIAFDYDHLRRCGLSHQQAIQKLKADPSHHDPILVEALASLQTESAKARPESLPVEALRVGMILAEDVRGTDDLLVAARGQELTPAVLERLERLARVGWLAGPIKVHEAP